MTKKYLSRLLIVLTLTLSAVAMAQMTPAWAETFSSPTVASENLLVNGNMEEIPFYWKPPNHFVAGGWLRWWYGSDIPEYDDVRAWRPQRYDGDHAQVYFRWGVAYTAGIYQQVQGVQPCTFYRFEMYGRNHSLPGANHHARLGLDPQGRVYNDIDNPGISALPDGIVWSDEQTFYQVWGRHQVVAEAAGEAITAITYASPDPGYGYYDTFWDAGSLVMTEPPEGILPPPPSFSSDGFITNLVTQTILNYLLVEWDTAQPASTQVWYNVLPAWTPFTPTAAIYLPLVASSVTPGLPPDWRFSPADQTPRTHHQVLIGPFQDGETVRFMALSRRLSGESCLTSSSGQLEVTIHLGPIYRLYVPVVLQE